MSRFIASPRLMPRFVPVSRVAALALSLAAPLVLVASSVHGDQPPGPDSLPQATPSSAESPEASENPGDSRVRVEKAWGFRLIPIDRWMRMHLLIPPHLAPEGQPLLVESVAAGSPAEAWRIQPGDVILESDRGPLQVADRMGSPNEVRFFRILRRGEPSMVHRKPWQDGTFGGPPVDGRVIPGGPSNPIGVAPPWGEVSPVDPAWPGHPRFHGSPDFPAMPGGAIASASTDSSHGSAVAISQAGSRIQVEVSENGAQVRLEGSIDSIRRQIRESKLSPATTEKIEAALRRIESYR